MIGLSRILAIAAVSSFAITGAAVAQNTGASNAKDAMMEKDAMMKKEEMMKK